jgi:predicted DNA-binding ribbon-helix-helix protein
MGKYLTESTIVKRSIVIRGHKTSVTLEEPFWSGLWEIARGKGYSLSGLVAQIDSERAGSNLSSAIRMYVLEHFRALYEMRPAPKGGAADERLNN